VLKKEKKRRKRLFLQIFTFILLKFLKTEDIAKKKRKVTWNKMMKKKKNEIIITNFLD
jgi:hypothetical protein